MLAVTFEVPDNYRIVNAVKISDPLRLSYKYCYFSRLLSIIQNINTFRILITIFLCSPTGSKAFLFKIRTSTNISSATASDCTTKPFPTYKVSKLSSSERMKRKRMQRARGAIRISQSISTNRNC